MADGDQLFARFGKVCPPGTVLFEEGAAGDTMFVLQSGRVRISKEVRGEEKTLAILGAGEFFGEMAILNDKPRTATAEVMDETRLLIIDRKTFEQMVVSNAEIAVRLIKKLARRLDSANALIEVLMHRDPKARVILGLSREADVVGQKRSDGSVLVPMDANGLAGQVGLEAADIDGVIRRLSRLGIVDKRDDGYLIKDTERLREFLEFLQMQEKFGRHRLMDLKVLGCHGGETPKHRTSSFLVDDRVGIDAGAITGTLSLDEQLKVEAILVSHAHMDHVRDLATIADNRCQQGGPPIEIVGTPATLAALKKHFFNDYLWPDFSKIPASDKPTITYRAIEPEKTAVIAGMTVKPILVSHTIETAGFVVTTKDGAIAYSGDTGPTKRFWEVLGETDDLRALLMEVSFPNDHHELAKVSGHHTPETLADELDKLPDHAELPILLYHIKPVFQAKVEKELARIKKRNLSILQLDDQFLF